MSNTLAQTTLSAAISNKAQYLTVASATDLSSPLSNFQQQIYVVNPGATKGELMNVVAVSGTQVQVARLSLFRQAFLTGAIVIINPLNPATQVTGFVEVDPPTVPGSAPILTWIVNVTDGEQWLYSTVSATWVAGFNNTSAPISPTVAVASVAGVITPSGPLFHVTGTNAITGFTRPNGFTSGVITIIPDAIFTWTTGDGSLGVAGTAVVAKALTFTYDFNAAKWYPSYIA